MTAVEIRVVGPNLGRPVNPVPTAGGLLVPIDLTFESADTTALDVLIIPALGTNNPSGVEDAPLRKDGRSLRTHLCRWSEDTGRELAAAGTGTFVLAEAELLDDRRATSWWFTGVFRVRYRGSSST